VVCDDVPVDNKTTRCLNCDASLSAGQAFCSVCGQSSDTHRLSLHDITHALVHVFTHADRSVFSLVRDLAHKPGRVAREYVAGKRRRYFNPFTFAIVVIGVVAPVVLAQLPLLALSCMVLFRSEKLSFTEHLVLAAYTSAFRSIFFCVFVAGFWAITRWNYSITLGAYMVLWLSYFGVACAQFYSGNRWWLWAKGIAAALSAQLTITAAVWASVGR
jgi:hypothetical protein